MRRTIVLITVLLAAGLFQAWFLDVRFSNIASRSPKASLTDAYTEALSRGQSYLLIQPDVHLLNSADPFSAENGKYHLLDASYYQGHYYLYFGITPFILLLVPWFKLTGTFLSSGACILVLLQIGYLLYGHALWLLFRNDRRAAVSWLLPVSFIAIIVSSGTWSLIGRPAIYEIEEACAYACFGAAVVCLVAADICRERKFLFLGGAALFAGLTMGCRPNYLPAVALVAGAIGYCCWKSEKPASERIKVLLLCEGPLLITGLALALWNYERFSSIFEFGYSHQYFGRVLKNLVLFSADNIPYNLHRYLAGGFRLGHYFPFIDGMRDGPFPLPIKTHEPVDQIYGCLILFPVLMYAAFALPRKHAVGGFLLIAAASNLFYLSGIGFGTYRYPTDYLGILSFAAGLGICRIVDIPSRIVRMIAVFALVPTLF